MILISSFCDLIFNNLGPGNVSLLWSINFLFHVVIAGLAVDSIMSASPIMSPTLSCSTHMPRTVLCQTARVSVHGVPLLGDLLERLFIHNYSSTVSNVSEQLKFLCL